MTSSHDHEARQYIDWFRHSSPYIHAHRGRTMVVALSGEALESEGCAALMHDLALLSSLGIRLVIVHGIRPQIDARLARSGIETVYHNGLRVTDDPALACVKDAAGAARVELEALLSMGVVNSPMAGARVRVASGNLVTARPLGVIDGIDYGHTGEVRRVDIEAIVHRLDAGAIVLVPPIGYSPSGEVFNLAYESVASSIAIALGAHKLIYVADGFDLRDRLGEAVLQMTTAESQSVDRSRLTAQAGRALDGALNACRQGVGRGHLLGHGEDGALLLELFTRDGVGTMVSAEPYDVIGTATTRDIAGILELIRPLEQSGVLVPRSLEHIETEIEHFMVMRRDGAIIGCGYLKSFPEDGMAELGCLATDPHYRREGRGDQLLDQIEAKARKAGIERMFVLTTQTSHWFVERGYVPARVEDLPMAKRSLFNFQRNSKVLIKPL